MSWLREDDNETDHPKIIRLIELTGYEGYYRLKRLRQWCARHRTGGEFTIATSRELAVKPRQLDAMIETRLVDNNGNGHLRIHNFARYNPIDVTGATRQARHRDKRRDT